jgi:hypothetical protein
MDNKLTKTNIVFDNVKEMRSEILILFDNLNGRINKLKEMYNEFVKYTQSTKTSDVKSLIFSLDSFYFQTSLLQKEYNYLKDYNSTIINRMYSEYYKLLKLIIDYVEKNMSNNKLHEILKNKKYPKYDYLDDDKQYPFELILQLNEDIITVVNYLIHIVEEKEYILRQYTTNQNYGLNVNNLVSTYNYELVVLQEQINLYKKYLEFFYNVHEKLFKRLITKISVLEAQLNTDIKFEGGLLSKKKDNKDLFEDLNINVLSKSTQRDLKKSIVGISPPNSTSSEIDIEEAFIAIDNNPVYDTNIIYNYSDSMTPVLSENYKEKKMVANDIFEKHNLNINNEDSSRNIIISRLELFHLDNKFTEDNIELNDIISDEKENQNIDITKV